MTSAPTSATSSTLCTACHRSIDSSARLCPYCGADPSTGERLDTQAIIEEVFKPRTLTKSESVMEYARQRQGVVIGLSVLVAFLILFGLHQFATMRNSSIGNEASAVPLTEVTDLSSQKDETKPVALPKLDFQYDGRPQAMRTYIVESGAIAPPPPPPATTTTPAPTSTSPR